MAAAVLLAGINGEGSVMDGDQRILPAHMPFSALQGDFRPWILHGFPDPGHGIHPHKLQIGAQALGSHFRGVDLVRVFQESVRHPSALL